MTRRMTMLAAAGATVIGFRPFAVLADHNHADDAMRLPYLLGSDEAQAAFEKWKAHQAPAPYEANEEGKRNER